MESQTFCLLFYDNGETKIISSEMVNGDIQGGKNLYLTKAVTEFSRFKKYQ